MSIPKPKKMKIVAVVLKELEPLMRVLGIDEVYTSSSAADCIEHLKKLIERDDVAVIVVQHELVENVKELPETRGLYPSIVVIPGPRSMGRADVYSLYQALIRRYVGMEVRVPE